METSNIQNKVLALSAKMPNIDYSIFEPFFEEVENDGIDYISYNSSYVVDGHRIRCEFDELKNLFVLDSYKGWQVLRVFQFRFNIPGPLSWMRYRCCEVAQRWVNANGEVINLCRNYWRKNFNMFNSKSSFKVVADIPTLSYDNWYSSYPQFQVAKLANIGYRWIRECVKGVNDELAQFIDSNAGEFLFKCGYKKFFNSLVTNNARRNTNLLVGIKQYFDEIKVAHRHHFNFTKDIKTWFDTIRMMKVIGADTHNPIYICSNKIKSVHDMFVKRFNKFEKERIKKEKEERLKAEQKQYYEAHKMFLGIKFSDDANDLHFHIIQDANEMIEEGRKMHNCVGGYVTHDNSLIISCTDGVGKRIATIEVLINSLVISQNYGPGNTHPKFYNEICKAVNSNMYQIRMAKQGMKRELAKVA